MGFGLDPGRGSSHDLHRSSFSKFRAIHTEHSHWLEDILNCLQNPFVGGAMEAATAGFGTAGSLDSHAIHLDFSFGLVTQKPELGAAAASLGMTTINGAENVEAGRLAGGNKSKVGKLADPIGKTTAVRSEVMGSSFSSWRTASLVDSRRGAAFPVRIFPPDWALLGVLATGPLSSCVFTVGGGRLTTFAAENLVAGGPKVG